MATKSDLDFGNAGLYRDVAFEAATTDFLLDLVRHNLVIALLPPIAAASTDEIGVVPLADGPTHIEYLAWSDFNPSPAAQAFLEGLSLPESST